MVKKKKENGCHLCPLWESPYATVQALGNHGYIYLVFLLVPRVIPHTSQIWAKADMWSSLTFGSPSPSLPRSATPTLQSASLILHATSTHDHSAISKISKSSEHRSRFKRRNLICFASVSIQSTTKCVFLLWFTLLTRQSDNTFNPAIHNAGACMCFF